MDAREVLRNAAKEGDLTRLNEAIQQVETIDAGDINGWTALHHAALFNRQECVRALVRAKANTNVKNARGETPLHLAVLTASAKSVLVCCWFECVVLNEQQSLLHSNVAVDERDNDGMTPLACALQDTDGGREVAEALLDAGALLHNVKEGTVFPGWVGQYLRKKAAREGVVNPTTNSIHRYMVAKPMELPVNMLQELSVQCPWSCVWHGLLEQVPEHVRHCEQRHVECPDCKTQMAFVSFSAHAKLCPRRFTSCKYCKCTLRLDALNKHETELCLKNPHRLVLCGCGRLVEKDQQLDHVSFVIRLSTSLSLLRLLSAWGSTSSL